MARQMSKKDRVLALAARAADLRSEAEEIRSELEAWFDTMPDSIQSGTRGDAVQEIVDALSELEDALSTAEDLQPEW